LNRHQQHLLHLTYIRTLILFVICLALYAGVKLLRLQPDLLMTGTSLVALIALNLTTYMRLHSAWPVFDAELFAQLCADVVIYAALLYQFGGATNPFVFVLLIPLIISATTLPRRLTLLIALLVAGLYTSLLFNHLPLLDFTDAHQHTVVQLFNQHITGLWISFILTVGVISIYVVQMRQTLAERDHDLSAVREQRIHDQQLLALATLAAGTAHELRTPLSTLRVILKDMQSDHPELDEDLSLMLQQVDCCTDKLRNMTEEVASGKPAPIRLDAFLAQVLESWIVMRPQVSYTLQPLQEPVPIINTSVILQQALLNLLNNAADACPDAITISVHYPEADRVTLRIRDHGPGLSPEQLASMGKPFFTTKGGLGIGLFLTTTSLATQDGEVYLYNHPGGGTLTEVTLKTSGSDLQDTEND